MVTVKPWVSYLASSEQQQQQQKLNRMGWSDNLVATLFSKGYFPTNQSTFVSSETR
jgi:hypothetical protein